jgi:hypothetical protein
MTLVVGGLIRVGIALPHALHLERTSPRLAASIWLAALALRALAAAFCALFIILYLPATELFALVTHWCWHAVVPLLATHLSLSGHPLGDVALVMPAFVLTASGLSVTVGLWRTARRVHRLLQCAVVGPGPQQSLVFADGDLLVAAAGLRRPRVVISAGALLELDDEELAASLAHERGHIAQRHRYLVLAGELCLALARFIPGSKTASRELLFHLERDADRYAVARIPDPAALVTAIGKAAGGATLGAPALALGGGVVSRRLQVLLDDDTPRPAHRRDLRLRVLALVMTTMVALGVAALPSAAHAGLHRAAAVPSVQHCAT